MKQHYHLTAWLIFSCCCALFANVSPPQASFGSDTRSGCGPISIKFFDSSTGDIDQWYWEFPGADTTVYTVQNPVVTYSTPGIYDVKLRVSGPNGVDEITQSAYVQIANRTSIPQFSKTVQGYQVRFTNQSSYADSYLWDFGDGTFSNEENPVHTYTGDGVYIVRLKTINDCGDHSLSDVLIFEPKPQPLAFNANDQVAVYPQGFRPGVNLGYFPPWRDDQLADIAAGNPEYNVPGAGCKSVRPALHESFLEEWGYDIRIETFEHYGKIGLKDNTAIIGFPSEEHRDSTFYCPDHPSTLFANLYTDIWDNGENGTPVNDDNYLALYLYKVIHLYGEHIQYYEIWNEPGFDYTFVTGWLPPGTDGNWWENDPEPCDYKLRAPIYHYIRTLRVAYEVIKTLAPESNVTLASVGYTSFLDAVLRNTDNPSDGSVHPDYPLGGGAYFDAIAVHSYPHFDGTLRYWDQATQRFVYSRHSDQAASGIKLTRDTFQTVLARYGYNGLQYPEKEYIITEINIPRKAFGDYIGGEEEQVNYIIKAYVEAVRNDIRQMHVYDMSESFNYHDAVNEFQLMGLYKRLFGIWPYEQEINKIGIAYKTASDLLFKSTYDPSRTAALQLPAGIDGAAFLDQEGFYTYVLWAKTTTDQSEIAQATYSFPPGIASGYLRSYDWDHSYHPSPDSLAPTNISLTATPIFLQDKNSAVLVSPTAKFKLDNALGCAPFAVQFTDESTENVTNWEWSFPGGTPSSSTEQHPSVTYQAAGTYSATLTVYNPAGSSTYQLQDVIRVNDTLPTADFTVDIFDKIANYTNLSTHASHYRWDLGDFNITDEINPTHNYPIPAIYHTELIAMNGCGADTATGITIINPDQTLPQAGFTASSRKGCVPLTIQFSDRSTSNTNEWWWLFQGGTPGTSTEANPVVTYDAPGVYFVQLIASNAAGSDIEYRDSFIVVDQVSAPVANFSYTLAQGNQIIIDNQSTNATSYQWDFGDGNHSTESTPHHTYGNDGQYTIELIASNACGADTITQHISILSAPNAQFSVNREQGCVPLEIQFNDNTTGQVNTRSWFFPGGHPATSSIADPVVIYDTAGWYDVQLVVSNAAGSDSLLTQQYIHILDKPVAAFTFDQDSAGTVSFSPQTTDADSVYWWFGDGNGSSINTPIHTYLNSGDFEVSLIAFNPCGQDTLRRTVTVELLNTATTKQATLSALHLFPNPNNGNFLLFLKGIPQETIGLTIYNSTGQQIMTERIGFQTGELRRNLTLPNLASGAYLLQIRHDQKATYRKFIVK